MCTPKTGVIGLSTRALTANIAAAVGATCVLTAAVRLDRSWLITGAFVGASASLGLAAVIDAAEERLPNRLLLGALGLLVVAPLGAWEPGALLVLASGLLLGGVPMLAVLLVRGVGIGDVKFAAVLGAAAALVHPLAALATVFLAALGSSSSAAARRLRRLPLGPWLWTGFAISTLVATITLEGRT